MKKLNSFKEEEKKEICKTIDMNAGKVGVDWSGHVRSISQDDKYGICRNCREFRLSKTKYGRTYAYCDTWERYMRGIDCITECNLYVKRSALSLDDMKNIAIMIDVKDKTIGF